MLLILILVVGVIVTLLFKYYLWHFQSPVRLGLNLISRFLFLFNDFKCLDYWLGLVRWRRLYFFHYFEWFDDFLLGLAFRLENSVVDSFEWIRVVGMVHSILSIWIIRCRVTAVRAWLGVREVNPVLALESLGLFLLLRYELFLGYILLVLLIQYISTSIFHKWTQVASINNLFREVFS